jgi:hypothetical protein
VNPKITSSSSLESYGPYLLLKKASKNPHAFAIHGVFTLVTKGCGQGKFCTMIGKKEPTGPRILTPAIKGGSDQD